MEEYASPPSSPSSSDLAQTVRNSYDHLPELTWRTFIAVIVFSCIATRIITGLQSRRRKPSNEEPQSVKIVPYWLPWIGHGLSLTWDHVTSVCKARDSAKESVFGLLMGGVRQNVVVSPSITKTILSSPDASSAAVTAYVIENVFGDTGAIHKLKPEDSRAFHETAIMREPFITKALATELRLIERETPNLVTFCRSIVDQAPWERASQVTVDDYDTEVRTCEANLFSLVKDFIGYLSVTLFMGSAFTELFFSQLEDLWTMENRIISLLTGAPRWLPSPGVSAAHPARRRLLEIFSAFHQAFIAWDDGRDPGMELRDLEDVSEPIKERIRISRKLGLSSGASAPGHLSQLWALLRNTPKVVFWNLLHIYADPKLLEDIRKEISPYAKATRVSRGGNGFPFQEPPKLSIDLKGIIECCPLFKACYYETIRLESAGVSFRQLTSDLNLTESDKDAAIDGLTSPKTYKLQRGDYIAISHGAHQKDDRYFHNPGQYDPQRFIRRDSETGETKVDSRTITPFHDNIFEGKGQHFAEREIFAFTAAILSLWDIEPVGEKGWKIPGHKSSVGTFLPLNDIRVKMKMRV